MAAKKTPKTPANKKPVNKSAYVRSLPSSMPGAEVVTKAKAAGITISLAYVYGIRAKSKMKRRKAAGTPASTLQSGRAAPAPAPLAEFVAQLPTLLGKMTPDEIASFLRGSTPGPQPTQAALMPATTSVGMTDIARAILALPDSKHRLRDVERAVVAHALATTKGNVSAAARLLGTERKALERRVGRYKIVVRR